MNIQKNEFYYGFDVGGTKIELAIFDANFNKLHSQRTYTPTHDYKKFIDSIMGLVEFADNLVNAKGKIGIGIPGIVNHKTKQQLAVNVPCLTGKNLVDELTHLLNRKVAIENDCRCFALSEANTEQTKNLSSIFGTILGTGAGGGLVFEGKLFRGSNGIAGEWGHVPMSANIINRYNLPLFKCNCGLTACNERYLSGTGLAQVLDAKGFSVLNTEGFSQQLSLGNNEALKLFDMYLDMLASALASLQLLYDVDAFVLGGGLSNIQNIYSGLPKKMTDWLLPNVVPAKILPPVFGDSSGVRGAAMLNQSI